MQLKRDTEYALRIMTCIAEHLKKDGPQAGVSPHEVITDTGIPVVTFYRICRYLEEQQIILKRASIDGRKRLYPGKDFWQHSILSIGRAVEGNMELFILFDKSTPFAKTYGEKLQETQADLNQLLSKTTLKDMIYSHE